MQNCDAVRVRRGAAMARARPLNPDDRRAQLLAAARAVFARQGYHHASVSDILEEAAVARGTFYNYFDSKRAVFGAVLEDLMEDASAVVEPIDVRQPLATQVQANIGRLIQMLQGESALARVLFVDAAGIDDEAREALASFYRTGTERIERALRTGQAMGVVAEGEVSLLAMCLLGAVKEPVFQSYLRREQVDVAALTGTVFGLITRGVFRS